MIVELDPQDLNRIVEILQWQEQSDLAERVVQGAQQFIEQQQVAWKDFNNQLQNPNRFTISQTLASAQTYRDFSLIEVKERFNLENKRVNLFPDLPSLEPSEYLQKALSRGFRQSLLNEKERSEAMVYPFLSDLQAQNDFIFKIFSGVFVNIDEMPGLRGEFDFLFSLNPNAEELEPPIFMAIEAKQSDITGFWGQIVAQMVGAREFNRIHNASIDRIYGCITTSELWHFLELKDDIISIDIKPLSIYSELPQILAIFQEIILRSHQEINNN